MRESSSRNHRGVEWPTSVYRAMPVRSRSFFSCGRHKQSLRVSSSIPRKTSLDAVDLLFYAAPLRSQPARTALELPVVTLGILVSFLVPGLGSHLGNVLHGFCPVCAAAT